MDALTVYHGRSLEGYRKVQDLRADSASTEQLREAMIHYRALFEDLTGLREAHGEPARDRVAEIRDRAPDSRAVTNNGTYTEETAEPVTAEPVTADPGTESRVTRDSAGEGSLADERDLAARNDELAAENASRTTYPPR
jgi:hypothetical protein